MLRRKLLTVYASVTGIIEGGLWVNSVASDFEFADVWGEGRVRRGGERPADVALCVCG